MSSSADRPGTPSTTPEAELLREFEPVVRFTAGEQFFPMDIERYVRDCSLWLYHPDDHDEQVVPAGELTIDRLVEPREARFGSVLYMRFVPPLSIEASARALAEERSRRRHQRHRFRAGLGRLARGGLLPRLIDALFSATLLLRGRVPRAGAAAAVVRYARAQEREERYVYHGRVVRQSGWTVCQYWFFYSGNNWRSGFHGVNDHEADWELVNVYLYERDGELVPEWVAYASHDSHGADLRRRWDDAEDLTLEGRHPVVYAGAGSHASYFRAGEYQAEVPLPVPEQVRRGLDLLAKFWRRTLGQVGTGAPLRVPFIDFARGDGLSVGPGQDREWTPTVISEATPWVSAYRGLWGYYAQDPISGENAPGGPMYNRDGSPRPSWFDPLGFAELDKLPPPPLEPGLNTAEAAALRARQRELDALVEREASALRRLGVRLASMEGSPHLAARHAELEAEVARVAARLKNLRRERAENEAVLERLVSRIEHLRAGRRDGARAHIRHAVQPVPPAEMRFNRAAELLAAFSLSLLLLGTVALIQFAPSEAWAGAIVLLIAIALAESILRATFVRTVNRIAVILALVATVILLLEFWREAVVGVLTLLAVFLVFQRIREFRS